MIPIAFGVIVIIHGSDIDLTCAGCFDCSRIPLCTHHAMTEMQLRADPWMHGGSNINETRPCARKLHLRLKPGESVEGNPKLRRHESKLFPLGLTYYFDE